MTLDDLRKNIDDFVDSVDLSKVDIENIDLKKVDLDFSNIDNDVKNFKNQTNLSADEKKELDDRVNIINDLKEKLKQFKEVADKIKIANHTIEQTKIMMSANPSISASLVSVIEGLEKQRDALNTSLGQATVDYYEALNNYNNTFGSRVINTPRASDVYKEIGKTYTIGSHTVTLDGMTYDEAMQECRKCLRCDHFGCGVVEGGRV